MIKSCPKTRAHKRSKTPNVMALKRKLDKRLSAMVRTRDAELPCISCGEYNILQAGHFVKRKPLTTRWHPMNVNGECAGCNAFDESHLIGYIKGIERKYGQGVAEELVKLSKVRWKVLPDQLQRLIAATNDPDQYVQVWDEVEKEFSGGSQ